MEIKIAPSILSADFGRLDEEIAFLEPHCDLLHVDVMDGHFVPNITIGAPVVKCLKTTLPLDIHLMIEHPEKYIDDFVKAGVKSDKVRLIVHSEACKDLPGVLSSIVATGAEAGVSIKPGTPVSDILGVLELVTEVLVMTVEPGFGGQKFMAEMVGKIAELKAAGFKGDIGVDGGINAETGKLCREAGATLLVAGNYVFSAEDRVGAIKSLR